MSRNRKHRQVVRLAPALKALSLCAFLGGSSLGYVWQKDQIYLLGDQLKRSERRLEQIGSENERRARVLAAQQTSAEIEARIRKYELGMVAPQPDQIVRLVEVPPTPEFSTQPTEQLFAAHPSRSWLQR